NLVLPTARPTGTSGGGPRSPAFALLLALRLLTTPSAARQSRHSRHASHTAHHLPHHLLALKEPDHERVDLADSHSGAVSDPQPARAIQDLGIPALLRCHRVDDGSRAVKILVADLAEHLAVLRGPWQHAEQVADRPELAYHRELLDEVLEREAFRGDQLAGHLSGLLLVKGPFCLLDQRQDVAEVEYPRSHPVRVEQVEVLELLTR